MPDDPSITLPQAVLTPAPRVSVSNMLLHLQCRIQLTLQAPPTQADLLARLAVWEATLADCRRWLAEGGGYGI